MARAGQNLPQARIDATAQRFLNQLQFRSIAANREFCGFFVLSGGQIMATAPRMGTQASCNYAPAPANVVASYHTHAAYVAGFDNEVPSRIDIEYAIGIGLSDYVSTPGGRLWRVDGRTGTATQVCGRGCLVSDPNFVPRDEENIAQSYTIATLQTRRPR